MVYPQWNFASNFTLYSDILKGVISILKSAVVVKDPIDPYNIKNLLIAEETLALSIFS